MEKNEIDVLEETLKLLGIECTRFRAIGQIWIDVGGVKLCFGSNGSRFEHLENPITRHKADRRRTDTMHETHEIKVDHNCFVEVLSGRKSFIITNYDSKFRVGDSLILKEWLVNRPTGLSLEYEIMYITDFEQKDGYIVIGIELPRRCV